ncbi:MAG: GNAT family N-acetyltransferase [Caulobacterales bacterium]
MIVRPATEADYPAIRAVTQAAFAGSSGDEAGIIEGVRTEGLALVELVAEADCEIVGHVLFSRMRSEPERAIAALGPLAVAPAAQRTGVGSALSRAGIAACRAAGMEAVVVLGHPPYYPRFGFSAEAARTLASPYAGRPAFMALALAPGALDAPLKVDYPAAFG